MIGVLLSIALLFGVYDGMPESIESDSQAELQGFADEVAVVALPEPEVPPIPHVSAIERANVCHPTTTSSRIFRPPRS